MSAARGGPAAPGRVREITSLANPAIKDIRALAQKKHRDRQGAFLAEGLKLVVDALDLGWTVRCLIHAKSARDNAAVMQAAARTIAAGGDVFIVSEKVLGAICRRDNPQMAVGVLEQRYTRIADIKPGAEDLWIGLDRVRDPGNLGTIVRTGDAVGARGVLLIGDCTDPFSLEAVRATMGSVFAVALARCGEGEFLQWRQGFNGLVAGTHLDGAVDYRTPDYTGKPVLLLMGNEQQGLTPALASACDVLVRIPQAGRADSLNLAVSTGVMLYEIRRHAFATGPESANG